MSENIRVSPNDLSTIARKIVEFEQATPLEVTLIWKSTGQLEFSVSHTEYQRFVVPCKFDTATEAIDWLEEGITDQKHKKTVFTTHEKCHS